MSEPLTVRIASFSYRDPPDLGGIPHGGGFVFDCRCLPNPGRDPRYAPLTGLDREVRELLESSPDVSRYAALACDLVQQSVANYLEREFTQLSVLFGCTGGRHRSVYLASRLSGLLQQDARVRVSIEHLGLRPRPMPTA